MRSTRGAVLTAVALALLAALVTIMVNRPGGTPGLSLCGERRAAVAGGAYVIQNDEWNSTAPECVSYSRAGAAFTVSGTSISQSSGGKPGGYPSVFAGCFYGTCTSGSGLPRRVSSVTPGSITSDWTTTQPAGGSYDAAYDIWFSTVGGTGGFPDAAELMIWIGHQGPPRPLGGYPLGTVRVAGRTATVWYGYNSAGGPPAITYELSSPVSSVSGLDIGAFVHDAMDWGFLRPNWYLIDVQAGFELWQGGQGLATDQFSVHVR
jgi:hypothetical protein